MSTHSVSGIHAAAASRKTPMNPHCKADSQSGTMDAVMSEVATTCGSESEIKLDHQLAFDSRLSRSDMKITASEENFLSDAPIAPGAENGHVEAFYEQQGTFDPRLPGIHIWNLVSEKNTFLELVEDCAGQAMEEVSARRSTSCPPRLEADGADSDGQIVGVLNCPPPSCDLPAVPTSSDSSDGAIHIMSNPAFAKSKPCSQSPTRPSFQRPRCRSSPRADQRLEEKGKKMMKVPATLASAKKSAASKQKVKKHKAPIVMHKEQADDWAVEHPEHDMWSVRVWDAAMANLLPRSLICIPIVIMSLLASRFAMAPQAVPAIREPSKGDDVGCSPFPRVMQGYGYGESFETDEAHRVFPSVTLYAPCPLTSYVKLAKRFRQSAHRWRFMKTETTSRLLVQHHGEDPLVILRGIENETKLELLLAGAMTPPVGMLTSLTRTFYGTFRNAGPAWKGLVTLFPESTLDGSAFDSKYHGMLQRVRKSFAHEYDFTYMLPFSYSKYRDWIASEFRVSSFPCLAVHQEFPGRPSVHCGDMSEQAVADFIRQVSQDRTQYGVHTLAVEGQARRRAVCDAEPVLSSP